MKKNTFYTIVCFFIFNFTFAQTNNVTTWENLFKSAERSYIKGRYAEAIKSAKKNLKTIKKKYNDNLGYKLWIDVFEAKCLVKQSKFNQALVLIKKVEKELPSLTDANEKATLLAKIASTKFTMGLYAEIEKNITQYLSENTNISPTLQSELELLLIACQNLQEEWDKIGLKPIELTSRLQKLSTEKKSKQVTKIDLQHRKNLYAQALSLQAEVLTAQGNYQKADSIFKIIKKQVEKNAEDHIISAYWEKIGDNFKDKHAYKDAINAYKKAKGLVKKKTDWAVFLQGKIAETYTLQGEAKDSRSALDDMIELADNFGVTADSTIYHLQEMILGAERDIRFENAVRSGEKLEKMSYISQQYLPKFHPLRLKILDKLHEANTIGSKPNIQKAEKSINQALEMSKYLYGENSTMYELRMLRKANLFLVYTDNFDEPKKIFDQKYDAKFFNQRQETHKDFIEAANIVVNFYEINDKYTESEKLLNITSKVAKQKFGEKDLKYGIEMSKLAEIQLKTGKYKEAEMTMQTAMKAIKADANRKSKEYAQALASMAKIYATIGNYEEAEDALKSAERIYEKLDIKDLQEKGSSVEEMAFLYLRMGQFAATEELLIYILNEKENQFGKQSRKLINPLNQLANLYLLKGDYIEAEKNARQAENIAKKVYGENNLRTAEVMTTLAKFYAHIGDYKKSEQYLNQVLNIQKNSLGNSHIEVGNTYINLALVKLYANIKNAPESEKLIVEAINIMQKNFDDKHPLYAEALKTQGEIFIQSKKYNEALETLKKANQIWLDKLQKRNTNSAYTYRLMADIYAKQKKFSEAKDFYEKAGSIYKKLFSEENPEFVRTETKMAQMFFVKGDLKKANDLMEKATNSYLNYIKIYFPALSETEKSKFWAKIQPDFEFYNSLAVKQAEKRPELLEKMYNFRLATKALLLSSALKMRQRILNGNDQLLKEKFKKWLAKKEQLTNLLALSEEERQQTGTNFNQIQDEINILEKELSEESEEFASSKDETAFTWEQIKDKLDKDECAIEVIRFRKFEEGFTDQIQYAFLAVSKETKRNPKLALIENGNELETKYFKYYKNMVEFQQPDKYSYTKYWQPIEHIIGKAKIVYFSPDGVYNQINPEGFRIEDDKYVIDNLNVRFVSNTKDLLSVVTRKERKKQRRSKKNQIESPKEMKAVLFGNPTFYTNDKAEKLVNDLPGTKLEILQVDSILTQKGWKVKIFQEQNALESEIKQAQNPLILHIATHGFFYEVENTEGNDLEINQEILKDPMRRNGLLAKGAGDLLATGTDNFDISEGILTAYEALSLHLDNTMVVLSACETGKGEVSVGEGVYGLQRAFLVAGASSVVMSLFKVNDDVTERLMQKFYEKYDVKIDNKRQAFNDAQKEIKKEYPHPAFWAVFNMIGAN